jgi:hypothetical protein
MKSSRSFHFAYIVGSLVAAIIALAGILSESPMLYGTVPGIIGGAMAIFATVRFLKEKKDLPGFIATICGFIYYQEFQANPVTQPDFVTSLQSIPIQDQAIGIFLSNLVPAILLISLHLIANSLHGAIRRWVPDPARVRRADVDRQVMTGFWVVFIVVAVPNVLFGKVVVGAIDNILYQRMTWADAENYSGFNVWGGALGNSIANMGLWATSLLFLWMYLLRSRYRRWMLVLSPLVLLWTASVGLQGSRTYLVVMGIAVFVYFLGSPRIGMKSIGYAMLVIPVLFLLVQISTHFRGSGLQSVNLPELSAHLLEIRGNEGASSQIDGIQYFRTELLEKGLAANPVIGFFRGMVERPYEGLLMPVPRSLFPWKTVDESGKQFNLFYQNVRLGVPSDESFLGASPGLIGRELIKYGILGPLTLCFWLGLLLGLADQLYAIGAASDFHRIFATLLIAFVVAQARDFAPVWFIPFLPASVIFGLIARQAHRKRPAGSKNSARPKAKSDPLSASLP